MALSAIDGHAALLAGPQVALLERMIVLHRSAQ